MTSPIPIANAILNAKFRGTSYASTTPLFLALATAVSTDGTFTEVKAIGTDGYARQSITFGTVAANKSISSTDAATFSATGNDWASVGFIVIVDNATEASGVVTVVDYGTVSAFALLAGTQVLFPAGGVVAQVA